MLTPSALLVLTLGSMTAIVWLIYRRDMRAAQTRLANRSSVLRSPYGDIEFAAGGSGPDVLIVHGAAGGWDQGALIAEAMFDSRFHWIAPSRFGYLRSGCPAGATVDDQAHAYALLLDHLGIGKVAVVAVSAGGPSALSFAILYPQRVSSLTLISCAVARPSSDKSAAMVKIFRSDLAFWLTVRWFRKSFLRRLGIDADDMLARGITELQWIERAIAAMHPASLRARGAALDERAHLPGKRIAAIEAPTLIVHAKDDALQVYDNAAFAAVHIPRARLISFETGGHLIFVTRRGPIGAAVEQHIHSHLTEVSDAAQHSSAA